MKYKEQIQAATTVNEFLRFHRNPFNQNYANCRKVRSRLRIFLISVYGRRAYLNGLILHWMNVINKPIMLKIVAYVGNPPLCNGVTAVQSPSKSHTHLL